MKMKPTPEKKPYEEFDKILLADIGAGRYTYGDLNTAKLRDAVPAIALGKSFYRVIDGRLQALRKAGKIRYAGKAWEVVA